MNILKDIGLVFLIIVELLLMAYLIIGVIYAEWVTRKDETTLRTALKRIKLIYWWIPTFIERHKK